MLVSAAAGEPQGLCSAFNERNLLSAEGALTDGEARCQVLPDIHSQAPDHSSLSPFPVRDSSGLALSEGLEG